MFLESIFLLLSCSGWASGSQNASSVGSVIRVRLSNYSNPNQVLSDTGVPCDANSGICDPAFLVKLGTQLYSFEQSRKSRVFDNAASLNGEFFMAEFRLLQELPDLLRVSVKIEDNDAFDPVPETIVETVAEFHQLLPSVPGRRNNSVTKELFCTPTNKYVSFTLTMEVHCLPGLFGRRCSTQCNGEPIYPNCEKGDVTCEKSLEIIGCDSSKSSGGGVIAALQVGSIQSIFIITSAIVAVLIAAILGFVIVRHRRRQRMTLNQQDLLNILGSTQPQPHQSLSLSDSMSQQPPLLPPTRPTAGYKNPVYHRNQRAAQQSTGATSGVATSQREEEVYEEVEEPKQGEVAPPLPPKDVNSSMARR